MEYKLELLNYLLILKKKNEQISIFDKKIRYCINIFEKNVLEEKDVLNLFDKNVLDINPSIRSVCWKIALKYLSLNTTQWNKELCEKRKLYEQYIWSFVKDPRKRKYINDETNKEKEKEVTNLPKDDNNLDKNKSKNLSLDINENDENWVDSELFSQINKDTFRTRSEMSFFNLHPDHTITSNINFLNSIIDIDSELEDQEEESEIIPRLVSIDRTCIDGININDLVYTDKRDKTWDVNETELCNTAEGKKDVSLGYHEPEKSEESSLETKKVEYNFMKVQTEPTQKTVTENNTQSFEKGNSKKDNQRLQYDSTRSCDIIHPKRHYDLICRILFVYARIHPYIKYVQGMNEILAPLYFIIFNDPLCHCAMQGEADTFFCFTELMQRQRDIFCEGLDNTDEGINGKLEKFSLLFKLKEQDLWNKLYNLKIETQYYALKWILLLFNQEFDMADIIVLYDQIIVNDNENFILYLCLAILKKLKESLLCGNFSINLKLLQNIPYFNPYEIISEAKTLLQNDEKQHIFINELYAEYINDKRKRYSIENLKKSNGKFSNQSSFTNTDYICSYENEKYYEKEKNTPKRLFNNLKNKPIVMNIKNYITNKIDEIQKIDQSESSDSVL